MRLWHYIVENQSDWDIYVQPFNYTYNALVLWYMGTSAFALTLTRQSPDNLGSASATAALTDTAVPDSHTLRLYILQRLHLMFGEAYRRTEVAQATYERSFVRNIRFALSFVSGQELYINHPPVYV